MQPAGGPGFYRSKNRVIGGVCAGIAESLHIDPLWVRLAFVVLSFAQGVGVLLYVILWVVVPERSSQPPGKTILDSIVADLKHVWDELRALVGGGPAIPTQPPPVSASDPAPPPAAAPPPAGVVAAAPATSPPQAAGAQNWSWLIGVGLVVTGLIFLAINTGFINWALVWPTALIAVGVILLIRTLEHRRG
jgi:phage shock protein C